MIELVGRELAHAVAGAHGWEQVDMSHSPYRTDWWWCDGDYLIPRGDYRPDVFLDQAWPLVEAANLSISPVLHGVENPREAQGGERTGWAVYDCMGNLRGMSDDPTRDGACVAICRAYVAWRGAGHGSGDH